MRKSRNREMTEHSARPTATPCFDHHYLVLAVRTIDLVVSVPSSRSTTSIDVCDYWTNVERQIALWRHCYGCLQMRGMNCHLCIVAGADSFVLFCTQKTQSKETLNVGKEDASFNVDGSLVYKSRRICRKYSLYRKVQSRLNSCSPSFIVQASLPCHNRSIALGRRLNCNTMVSCYALPLIAFSALGGVLSICIVTCHNIELTSCHESRANSLDHH
jgi:hypothetical protein